MTLKLNLEAETTPQQPDCHAQPTLDPHSTKLQNDTVSLICFHKQTDASRWVGLLPFIHSYWPFI